MPPGVLWLLIPAATTALYGAGTPQWGLGARLGLGAALGALNTALVYAVTRPATYTAPAGSASLAGMATPTGSLAGGWERY